MTRAVSRVLAIPASSTINTIWPEPKPRVSSRGRLHVMELPRKPANCAHSSAGPSAAPGLEIPARQAKSTNLTAWIAPRRSRTWTANVFVTRHSGPAWRAAPRLPRCCGQHPESPDAGATGARTRPMLAVVAGRGILGCVRPASHGHPVTATHHRTVARDTPSGSPLRNPCSAGRRCTPSATIARLSPPSRTESPSMNDEEHVPQAGIPAAAADAEKTPVERLEALGVGGILWQLARDGQIIAVRCEMPQCYCFRGRRYFEPRSAPGPIGC